MTQRQESGCVSCPDMLLCPGTLLLCCCHSPSGYTQDANQNTPCTPLSTPVVVQLFMRATSPDGCTTDLINSVRDALTNFMKDPNSAYGERLCAAASSSALHQPTATGHSMRWLCVASSRHQHKPDAVWPSAFDN